MAEVNYDINYDDERFGQVESDKQQAMTELEQTYGDMIGESDQYYQAQIDAGVKTIMVSHSALNGVKMHENKEYIMKLKKEMGFEASGMIVGTHVG